MIIPHSDSVGMEAPARAGKTTKVTIAGPVLLPLVVISAPASSVLMNEPPTGAVTFTVSVQLPLAGIVRPAGKVTVVPPGAAAGAPTPPQVVLTFGVAAISSPLGKVSVSGAVRMAGAGLGLLKVMVSV